MAVEASEVQLAGGDEVPLQMTAEYHGDISGNLRRLAAIGNGRGGGGWRRLLRGCILDVQAICDDRGGGGRRQRRRQQFFLTTAVHGGKCWWAAGGGGGKRQRWRAEAAAEAAADPSLLFF